MSKVYMMVTITNRNKRKDFRTFFKEYGLPVFLETTGRGTAQSEVLDYFGLEESEKLLFLAIVTGETWKKLRRGLITKMLIDVPGTGVSFIVPLSSVGGRKTLQFLVNEQEFEKEEISLASFIIPQITVERSIYGIGLTTLVITVLLTGLLYRKVYEKVLTYGCVIVLVIPVFAYLLNGGLYIRDKVFIPFLPLLCYLIGIYLEKCRKRELSFIAGIVPYIITTIFVYIARNQFVSKGIGKSIWKVLLAESILFLICYVLYCVMKRYHKEAKEILMLALPSVICLAVTMNTFYQMNPDRYVSRKLYRDVVENKMNKQVKGIEMMDITVQNRWEVMMKMRDYYGSGYGSNILPSIHRHTIRTIRHSVQKKTFRWKNRSAMG